MLDLSIITINYNNNIGLQKTIESVFNQTFKNYEYIIVDGGSTDGSQEIIEENKTKFSSAVSENDKGIYNAMNKGIAQANGKYLLFLNSGDFLINKDCIGYFFSTNNEEDILCGDIRINEQGKYWIKTAPDKLSFNYFFLDTLPHQSALIKRQLFTKVGLYDEQYRFVSDWKFYMDAFVLHAASYKHIKEIITEYNYDGASSIAENYNALQEERKKVFYERYALFYDDYIKLNKSISTLALYNNSRAHSFLKNIMKLPFYKIFNKKWY